VWRNGVEGRDSSGNRKRKQEKKKQRRNADEGDGGIPARRIVGNNRFPDELLVQNQFIWNFGGGGKGSWKKKGEVTAKVCKVGYIEGTLVFKLTTSKTRKRSKREGGVKGIM